jgi:hypothetical protein
VLLLFHLCNALDIPSRKRPDAVATALNLLLSEQNDLTCAKPGRDWKNPFLVSMTGEIIR